MFHITVTLQRELTWRFITKSFFRESAPSGISVTNIVGQSEAHNGWLSEHVFIDMLKEREIKLKFIHLIVKNTIWFLLDYFLALKVITLLLVKCGLALSLIASNDHRSSPIASDVYRGPEAIPWSWDHILTISDDWWAS